MKRSVALAMVLVLILIATSDYVFGQIQIGTVRGTLIDSTGAVIAGCRAP